jgi:predicted metal-dependent hydrolase
MPLFRKTPRTAVLDLGDFTAEVVFGGVKNLNLRINPHGRVRVSVPWYVSLNTVRDFVDSKRDWIAKQRLRIGEHESERPEESPDEDSLILWGLRYPLRIQERPGKPSARLESGQVVLGVRPQAPSASYQKLIDAWYRKELEAELPPLFSRWGPEMGVRPGQIVLQKMKSRWGTCQPSTGTIRLNSELAKKPRECLDYVVIHELAHLIEASHGPRFVAVMDRHLPGWREVRTLLNGRAQASFRNANASS